MNIEIQITLKSLNNEIFVRFSLGLFTVSQRATAFFFFYDNVVFASFLVNTDTETAVVNVTYATREEAKT